MAINSPHPATFPRPANPTPSQNSGIPWLFHVRSTLARLSAETWLVGVVLLAAFVSCLLWGFVLPFNAAPDEVHHFNMDWYIAVHNALPIFDRSAQINHTTCQGLTGPCYASYASQPPGAPLAGALLMKVAHLLTGYPYERYQDFMGSTAPLDPLMHAARLASAIFVALYVLFLYLTTRLLIENPYVRATALVIGAFIPQVTFEGAYVNDDSIGMAAAAAVLYVSVRLLRFGLTWRGAAVAGLVLSGLALAKIDYYATGLVFVVCVLIRLREEIEDDNRRQFLLMLGIIAGIVAALTGWWFVRGWLLYADPIGLSVWRRDINAIAPNYGSSTIAGQGGTILTLLQTTPWRQWTQQSFWGEFDYMTVTLPATVYIYLQRLVLLAGAGLVFRAAYTVLRHRAIPGIAQWKWQIWGLLVVFSLVIVLQSMYNSLTNWFEPQGRYLFPALVPFVLVLALGIHAWSAHPIYRRLAFVGVSLAFVCLNAATLMFVIAPTYRGI